MESLVGPSPEFWRGRKLLITGHTGFKGAWLWLLAKRLGAEPCGIALPPGTEPNLFALAGLSGDARSCFADVRDLEAVRAAARHLQPDVVIHMAAQSLVRRSYVEPLQTLSVNVLGTAHILEAVRSLSSVRAVVVVTSDKCYADGGEEPHREDDRLGGSDPYSSSKACAELVVSSWRQSFFSSGASCGIASARAGNVVGGGDWACDRLIPDCVRAFQLGSAVEIRHPDAIRPWQHVLDALAGYLTLAERLSVDPAQYSQAWNFGPVERQTDTVASIVERAGAIWGNGAAWISARGAHPRESPALRVDASKAARLLGWRPRLDLDCAIRWTIDWYRRQAGGEDAAALCLEQIEQYLHPGAPRP